MAFMAKNKTLQMAGAPFAIYSKWDETNQFTIFEAALPVDQEVKGVGRVTYKAMPETKVITGSHFGRYDDIGPLYMAMDEYLKEFGLEETCCPMEVYITDPMSEPDTSKWQTDVYFPIHE
jgi:effector-binding domain-containing protein